MSPAPADAAAAAVQPDGRRAGVAVGSAVPTRGAHAHAVGLARRLARARWPARARRRPARAARARAAAARLPLLQAWPAGRRARLAAARRRPPPTRTSN